MQAIFSPSRFSAPVSRQATLRVLRRAQCALRQFSSRTAADSLAVLGSTPQGLAFDEVLRRLMRHGPNRLCVPPASAADLRGLALRLGDAMCTVRRRFALYDLPDGLRRVPAHQLVRGDVICLSAGERVPADVRLLSSDGLVLERAILQPWPDASAMGDRVAAGSAVALVVATGQATVLGMLLRGRTRGPSWRTRLYEALAAGVGRLRTLSAGGVAAILTAGAIPADSLGETSLSLYGTLDSGLAWTHVSGQGTRNGLLSGGQTDSLWGLRGQEDLGGGAYASFALEGGLDLVSGQAEDSGRLFNYQSWLGLGNATLGELRLGRQYTVGQAFVSEIEVGSWKDFGMGALLRAADNYQVSDMISWRSPLWAGLQLGGSYSPNAGESAAGQGRTGLYSLAARYESGPWLLAASFERMGRVGLAGQSEGRHPQAWQLGLSYDLEVLRLALGWSRQRNGFVGRDGDEGPASLQARGLEGLGPAEFIDGGKLDAWYVGAGMPLGAGELQVQWSLGRPDWRWQDSGARARRIQVMSLGYVHPLSARTSLYAFAAHGRHYAMETAVGADEPRVSRVALGLTHHF